MGGETNIGVAVGARLVIKLVLGGKKGTGWSSSALVCLFENKYANMSSTDIGVR